MSKLRIYICGGIVVEINNIRFLFDPWSTCDEEFDYIFVSHGHTDHVAGLPNLLKRGVNRIYMTRETFLVLQHQGVFNGIPITSLNDKIHFVKIGEELDLKKGVSIEFLNAGHVIGSLMFRIMTKNVSVGYTGDFNFENTVVSERADILDTDILIMDSTYGDPHYTFPPRNILYEMIKDTLRDIINEGLIPVLHGYSLGKGQELTKLSDLFIDGVIGVDKRVGSFNRIYESSTKKMLGRYSIGKMGNVYIRGVTGRRRERGNHVHIFFTGWSIKKKYRAAISFPLSSHSDFMGLLNYVIENKPKYVYTLFSFAKTFSKFIKSDLGIDSMPVPAKPSKIVVNSNTIKKVKGRSTLDFYLNEKEES